MNSKNREILKYLVDNKQGNIINIDLFILETIFKIDHNEIDDILQQFKISGYIYFPDAIGAYRSITIKSKAIEFIHS
jgi:hypothetical protein